MLQTERLINALTTSPKFLRTTILKMLLKIEKKDQTLISSDKKRIILNFASNYYYSLYSPTLCAFVAYRSGLSAVGINDYASLSSAKEFVKACKILNIPYSLGYHAECVPLFNEKRASCYVYGVPYNQIKKLNAELSSVREEKKDHVEALVKKINSRLKKYGICLSVKEVISSSLYHKGGAVTEKHVAKALSKKLLAAYSGQNLIDFLANALKIETTAEEKECLLAENNKYLLEDLTRVLYNNVYVFKAGETLRDAEELITINKNYGAITAYKLRIKKFDEEFLNYAVAELKNRNFEAVCFDDTCLSEEDALKTIEFLLSKDVLPVLVDRMGMPRQVIEKGDMNEVAFDCMRAVVGSGISANFDLDDGILGVNTLLKCPSLKKRIDLFKKIENR